MHDGHLETKVSSSSDTILCFQFWLFLSLSFFSLFLSLFLSLPFPFSLFPFLSSILTVPRVRFISKCVFVNWQFMTAKMCGWKVFLSVNRVILRPAEIEGEWWKCIAVKCSIAVYYSSIVLLYSSLWMTANPLLHVWILQSYMMIVVAWTGMKFPSILSFPFLVFTDKFFIFYTLSSISFKFLIHR